MIFVKNSKLRQEDIAVERLWYSYATSSIVVLLVGLELQQQVQRVVPFQSFNSFRRLL